MEKVVWPCEISKKKFMCVSENRAGDEKVSSLSTTCSSKMTTDIDRQTFGSSSTTIAV